MKKVNRYDIWEYTVSGPDKGNPFRDEWIRLSVKGRNEECEVDGFYDGGGRYTVRFMPSFEGKYSFSISASFLNEEISGEFVALPAQENNHGPVRTANTFAMAHDDGTRHISLGTTCYVWELQNDELIEQTFETLEKSPFNKIRFCIFPKHYVYNLHEPRSYPYCGTPMDSSVLTKQNFNDYKGMAEGNCWDFYSFNPEHFRHIESCVKRLRDMEIQADIILFHPYDRWGFSLMSPEEDLFYIDYVVARLASFSNVWWSLANEYDLMNKSDAEWCAIAEEICKKDAYRHMRSIHNCRSIYDFNRPWCTHCSIQRNETYLTVENTNNWRQRYKKPVVLDEICYEGDIEFGWGNITGEEMTRRFWETALRGGFPGHGETMTGHDDILWWSHGGKLYGESPARIEFLSRILQQVPGNGLQLDDFMRSDELRSVPAERTYRGKFYLFYYSFMRPGSRLFHIDETTVFDVYVLDTWNMTQDYVGCYKGEFRVELPRRQYMAIMLKAR